ncbi:hypothetical protein ACHAWX_001524, partial [Stephanocyclus meneghinianus]
GNRRINVIVTGPQSFDRQVKRTTTSASTNLKYDHVVNTTARCELDTRADTNVPIAKATTAYALENGETAILVINKVLYFGSQMDHSLINPNQIRAYGIDVSDNPFDKDKDLGIDHTECFIPFETAGSTIFFESFVPSDEQLNSLQCIELTSSEEWDPNGVQLNKQATRSDTRGDHKTDDVLASVSEALCPSLFAKRLIESVNVESKQEFGARDE